MFKLARRRNLNLVTFSAFLIVSFIVWMTYPEGEESSAPSELSTPSFRYLFEDRKSILNVPNFHFILNNESLCAPEPNKRILLVLIHTARAHKTERMAIRNTYGRIRNYRGWTIRLAFIVGMPDPEFKNEEEATAQAQKQSTQLLNYESKNHGDIIMGSFVDVYRNITLKQLTAYKWALNYCGHADYILKADDDVYIDIFRMIDLHMNKPNDVICYLFTDSPPVRDPNSHWYASYRDYAGTSFPDYCSGWCYGISLEWIWRIYSVVNEVRFFWIDDVFLTGIVRERAEFVYGDKMNFTLIGKNCQLHPTRETTNCMEITISEKIYEKLCSVENSKGKRTFATVVYLPRTPNFTRDMTCMWNKTLDDLSLDHNKITQNL